MRLKELLLFSVILVISPAGIFDNTFGDDRDNQRHRSRYRERHRDGRQGTSCLKPVTDPTYKDACSACHFAYQAELLPSQSWKKIVEGLNDHFGESFSLEQATKDAILEDLGSNASEHSNSRLSTKIMKSLRGQVPMRITEIPYIKNKHRQVSAATLKRDSIGSASNCVACHRRAEEGIYDEHYVTIPD